MKKGHKGHIKLARRAFDPSHGDPLWLEARVYSRFEAWLDVIQLAAFKTRRHLTQYGPIELQRGEFVASVRWLADRWTWTVKRVRTWVATLEKWARLKAQRETQAGTVYLIVNYDRYQSNKPTEGTAEGTPSGTAGAQQGHKKEAGISRNKQKELTPTFLLAWSMYPRRAGSNPRLTAWRAWSARVREGVQEADLFAGAERYRAFCEAQGSVGTTFVMQGQRFFGPNREYANDWQPPATGGRDDIVSRVVEIQRADAEKERADEEFIQRRLAAS